MPGPQGHEDNIQALLLSSITTCHSLKGCWWPASKQVCEWFCDICTHFTVEDLIELSRVVIVIYHALKVWEEGFHDRQTWSRPKEKNYKECHMEHGFIRALQLHWILWLDDWKRLEAFKMWIWKVSRPKRVSWKVKVTNVDVLQRVNETRSILDTIWHWKHSWLEHVFTYDGLLKKYTAS